MAHAARSAWFAVVHSFRGGTGKSNITANLAAALAARGQRAAVVDLDLQSPGVHVLFGKDADSLGATLNHFLWRECSLADATYDVGEEASDAGGRLWLLPASISAKDIARVVNDGYDVQLLIAGLLELAEKYQLNAVLIDTHPGLNEETLLALSIADEVLVILRPDQQDLMGTAVTVHVARELGVPNLSLIVNNVLEVFDFGQVRQEIQEKYGAPVVGVLPNTEDLVRLASGGLFLKQFPEHRWTREISRVAEGLLHRPAAGPC